MSNEKFIFYYDESEHSRKLTKTTITDKNFGAYFVASFIGIRETFLDSFNTKYKNFENKYNDRKSNGELKSKTFSGKLQYGFASVDKFNIQFMNDLMQMFDKNIFMCFSVLNKIDYIIIQMLYCYKSMDNSFIRSLDYSLTKIISLYRPMNVINAIYRNDGSFIHEVKNFLSDRLKKNMALVKSGLKEQENRAIFQMMHVLRDYELYPTIDWNYKIAFDGFYNYLEEMKITDYQLIIDKEGKIGEESNTLVSAKSIKLTNSIEDDSKNHCGIRLADMFSGLISQFIKAINYNFVYKTEDAFRTKQYLDDKWFVLDETKLSLYKTLNYIVNVNNNAWYKVYAGIYSDDFVIFIEILYYFASFKDIEEYKKYSISQHKETLNTRYLTRLNEINNPYGEYAKEERKHKKIIN
jgi:hypothetical protein